MGERLFPLDEEEPDPLQIRKNETVCTKCFLVHVGDCDE